MEILLLYFLTSAMSRAEKLQLAFESLFYHSCHYWAKQVLGRNELNIVIFCFLFFSLSKNKPWTRFLYVGMHVSKHEHVMFYAYCHESVKWTFHLEKNIHRNSIFYINMKRNRNAVVYVNM